MKQDSIVEKLEAALVVWMLSCLAIVAAAAATLLTVTWRGDLRWWMPPLALGVIALGSWLAWIVISPKVNEYEAQLGIKAAR